MQKTVQYRVRPVTRYVITRWHDESDGIRSQGGCEERGEFNNHQTAYDVAYALCKMEHDLAGTPPDDLGFIYPKAPDWEGATPAPEVTTA